MKRNPNLPNFTIPKRRTRKTVPLKQHREHGLACGECRAGIRLREVKLANGNKVVVVERCDVCLLIDDSDPIYSDAPAVVGVLLDMLDVEYASGDGSIADAAERILDLVKSAAELRENMRQEDAECEDYPVLGKVKL